MKLNTKNGNSNNNSKKINRDKIFESLGDLPSIDNDKYKETRCEVHELIQKTNCYVKSKLNEHVHKLYKLSTNLKKISLKINKPIF